MASHPELRSTDDGVLVSVHVQPGAGRTEVVGRHGDALKVRVGAPPSGGRANDAVVALLADAFGVKPAAVTVTSGESNRQKRVRIDGLDLEAATTVIDRLLAAPAADKGRPTR